MYGINSMYSICTVYLIGLRIGSLRYGTFMLGTISLNSGYNSTKVGTAYTGMNIK